MVICFYGVCVIDQVLPRSPADYVRRPLVPPESQTLGLGHLQFEALITKARLLDNPNDFALIAIFGLLGLRIFEAEYVACEIGDQRADIDGDIRDVLTDERGVRLRVAPNPNDSLLNPAAVSRRCPRLWALFGEHPTP